MFEFALFFFFYGALKGSQDLAMIYDSSSWKDKYKQPFKPVPRGLYGWYHRLSGLSYKEKFPLSGTLLVSLTDWWHLFGFFRFWLIVWFGFYLLNAAVIFSFWCIPAYWAGFAVTYKFVRWIKKR